MLLKESHLIYVNSLNEIEVNVMFFRKLIIYTFDRNGNLEKLDENILKNVEFTPCGPLDTVKTGFVSPLDGDSLILRIGNHSLLRVKTESKIIPDSVVKKKTAEKIKLFEDRNARKAHKTERQTLKDEALIELTQVAFTKDQITNVWINHADNFIAIETNSFNRAETILSLLRKELGALSLSPLSVDNSVQTIFKNWLCNESAPANFIIHNDAVLEDPLEGNGKIKLIDENLTSDEVKSYLNSAHTVKSLSFSYQHRTIFNVNDELVFSKIIYSQEMIDKNRDFTNDEKEKRIEADFILVADELAGLINEFTLALQ